MGLHKLQFLIKYSIISGFYCILGSILTLNAQNCTCTIEQVANNSVSPCTHIIGETVFVNSVASFQNAIQQANANGGNMTILIEDGIYSIASPISYPYVTASNLVIRSLSGDRDMVILTGEGMKDVAPDTENGLHIAGNNVYISDLTIRDVGNHGIQVSGHNLQVYNVRIQNTYQQMLKGATTEESIENGVVKCCLFEYTAGTGPNYYIGGLDIHKGVQWKVSDNIFRNISSPSGSLAEHAIHFWNNSAGNTIERNLIINCDRGIGFGLGNSQNTDGMIRNNMIYNDGTSLFDDVGIGLESSPGTKVYNNTIFISYQNAIEFRFPVTQEVDIKNNLANKSIISRDGAEGILASNITDASADWFTDTGNGDLHLATYIPSVVDQGTDLSGLVEDDIDFTIRPQGSGYDIGSDELETTLTKDETPGSVHIFPNPNNGIFTIRAEDENFYTIHLYNSIGETISSEKITSQLSYTFNYTYLPNGIYFAKIIGKKIIAFKKIIIE